MLRIHGVGYGWRHSKFSASSMPRPLSGRRNIAAHLQGPAGCRSAAEAWAHSIALARDRYSRLMKTAGSGMAGEPRSVMQGLVGEGDE